MKPGKRSPTRERKRRPLTLSRQRTYQRKIVVRLPFIIKKTFLLSSVHDQKNRISHPHDDGIIIPSSGRWISDRVRRGGHDTVSRYHHPVSHLTSDIIFLSGQKE